MKLLTEMKTEGYLIHLYFLWLCDREIALKRVAERVSMGATTFQLVQSCVDLTAGFTTCFIFTDHYSIPGCCSTILEIDHMLWHKRRVEY